VVIGIILGFAVLFLERDVFLSAGYPYGGDTLSNLIPAAYFRAALASGSNPLMTPWYGGMYLWENGFFKGFYPLWWPLFVPGVPHEIYLKLLLAVHYIAAGIVAYVFARRELQPKFAVPFTLIMLLPMAYFNAHISKTMAWPWLLLGLWQLTPQRLEESPRRSGALLGLAGGAILLIANAYFAFYLAILGGGVLLAIRAWSVVRAAAVVSVIVGSPKLISVALSGGRDIPPTGVSSFRPLVAGLTGFPLDWLHLEAYAVVGIPICIIAAVAVVWAYLYPELFPANWMLGCLSAMAVGLLLATQSEIVYRLPLIDTFRVSHRAIIVVGLGMLMITVALVRSIADTEIGPIVSRMHTVELLIAGLLVISMFNAALPVVAQGESNSDVVVGREVAQIAADSGCEPVWLEINGGWKPGKGAYHKEIAYGLAEQGIAATATSYAKIGQDYSTHQDGKLTFEALILQNNETLPDREVTLTGGWFRPDRGMIDGSNFELVKKIQAPGGAIRIYSMSNGC